MLLYWLLYRLVFTKRECCPSWASGPHLHAQPPHPHPPPHPHTDTHTHQPTPPTPPTHTPQPWGGWPNIKHQPEPVWLVTEICAWQHVYYHLSLSDSDRLMLLVNMLPKLILFFCGTCRPQTCIPELQKPGHSDMYFLFRPAGSHKDTWMRSSRATGNRLISPFLVGCRHGAHCL